MINQNQDFNRLYAQGCLLTSFYSRCMKMQVGALVIDPQGKIISAGFNAPTGVLTRISSCEDEGCLIENGKCIRTIHAEDMAIFNAMKLNKSMMGSTVYLTHEPCLSCLKNLISAGVVKIFVLHWGNQPHKEYRKSLLGDNLVTIKYIYLTEKETEQVELFSQTFKEDKIYYDAFTEMKKSIDNILYSSQQMSNALLAWSDSNVKVVKYEEFVSKVFPFNLKKKMEEQTDFDMSLDENSLCKLIKKGLHLEEIYHKHLTEEIKLAFVKHGYFLERFSADENWLIRALVVKNGFIRSNFEELEDNFRVKVAKKDYMSGETTELDSENMMYTQWR